MKIGVLVTGVLRNFQKPLSNISFPDGPAYEYHLITWDTVQPAGFDIYDGEGIPAWRDIEEASNIVNFRTMSIHNSLHFKDANSVWNYNQKRQLFLWKQAFKVARNNPADFYILIRPDIVYVPFSIPKLEHLNPNNGVSVQTLWRSESKLAAVQDCIMSFSNNSLSKLEEAVDHGLSRLHEEWPDGCDIHQLLGEEFRNSGLEVQDSIGESYWLFACRRPGVPRRFTERTFNTEVAHTNWYLDNQAGGLEQFPGSSGTPKAVGFPDFWRDE